MSQSPLVLLCRQVSFCCGLQLRHPHWTEERNRSVYGRATGPHGSEFHLRIVLRGPVSGQDGMIVNLSHVKPELGRVAALLDDKFLDREVPFFRDHRPTAENIARFCWDETPRHISHGALHRLELDQGRNSKVEIQQNSMKISRFYEFAAAHRLFAPQLSSSQNWDRFDKCSNPAGHGHNFGLRVWIEGQPDPDSGFIINPQELDKIVDEEVYQRFDHKHLNEDCPEFTETGLVPTSENLSLVIFGILDKRLQTEGYKLSRIGLQETQKNYFEVEA